MATPFPGMDPDLLKQLQAIIAASGPSDEDKSAAKWQGLLAAGLGLMGARKGQEFQQIGNAGLLGLQARDQALRQSVLERGAGMNQALNAQQLMEHQRALADEQTYRKAMNDRAAMIAAQQQSPLPSMSPTTANAAALPFARLSQNKANDFDNAIAEAEYLKAIPNINPKYVDAAYARAEKLRPEYSTTPQVGMDENGNPYYFILDKQGNQKRLPAGVKPDVHVVDKGGSQEVVDYLKLKPGTTFTKTPTADAILSDARAREMAALKQQELQGGDQPMSEAAIKNAAARYNIDGTLPPMGMGKVAGTYRSAILNEAANQAAGIDPTTQRVNQIGAKADTASLSKVTQQATMVSAFEKNFQKNADLVLEYSAKVDRTGVPIANKWINAGKRAVSGDPQLSAYDAAVKSVSNEYAKIISGSMGNTAMAEGEIKKVESLLNAAQTPAQVVEVVNFMRRETNNRMEGFKEEQAAIRARLGGKVAAPSSGSVLKFDAQGNPVP